MKYLIIFESNFKNTQHYPGITTHLNLKIIKKSNLFSFFIFV